MTKKKADSRNIRWKKPTWGTVVRMLAVAGSAEQEYLDRRWIGLLLKACPAPLKRELALWILAQSPHYFIYQFSDYYPHGTSYREIIRLESERNATSRQEICQKLLGKYLEPNHTVLDFGCGPGYLAHAVAARVARVVATDVAQGIIACACAINGKENIEYVVNGRDTLVGVQEQSIDLVYSIAVFQHLLREQALPFLREFCGVLKSDGECLIHTILDEPKRKDFEPTQANWVRKRLALRLTTFNPDDWVALGKEAGFSDISVVSIHDIADLDDDVGNEHLVSLKK
jgi:ubiquinone/menaquinone biosynthesis C-methylase UbiE